MTSRTFETHELSRFLGRHYNSGDAKLTTMTSMGDTKGRWLLKDEDYPKFLDLMHDYLFVKKFRPNNFVEQRKSDGATPLLIDLDFAYPAEKNLQRTFETSQIHNFVVEVIHVIKENFDLKDKAHLRFFVTLRPQPYQSKTPGKKDIKDGVHIVCPDFSVIPEHHALIRHLVLEREAVKRCF